MTNELLEKFSVDSACIMMVLIFHNNRENEKNREKLLWDLIQTLYPSFLVSNDRIHCYYTLITV